MRRLLILPLLLAATAACEEKKPDWAKQDSPGAPLPAQVCAQVRKGLDALAKGSLDYNDKGEATLPVEAWVQMPPQQRDQLVTTLAYHASCAAGATSDAQTVVVRGDDGAELLRRTLSTRVDMGDLLGGE
jgi:hypothetical protein